MGGEIFLEIDPGRVPDLQREKRRSCGRLLWGVLATVMLVGLLGFPASGIGILDDGDVTTAKLIFIDINPVGDRYVCDRFTISGTTNLGVNEEILVEVYSSSFIPTSKMQAGEFSGQTGTVKVVKGTGEYNTWSFAVDASTFKPDRYLAKAQAITVNASDTISFNVITTVPTLTLSPSSGQAGRQVTISGNLFSLINKQYDYATISFNDDVIAGNIPMRGGCLGTFTTSITIPANTSQGTYAVRADGPNDYATASFTVTNIPPVAQIDANPESGPGPLLVRFDGTRSSDQDGSINAYRWDFDDDTQASGATVEHTYTRPHQYHATLTVIDNQGATDTASVFIDVDNSAPVAVASAAPESGSDPLMVAFDGSQSKDPDGTIRSYIWDFGDGGGGEISRTGHEYRTPGTYQAILTVTDDNGKTGQDTVQITVGNEIPVARISVSPQEGSAPLQVSFDASQSSDKDDNNLTFSWDYGDGDRGAGSTLEHTYQKEGTYQVSLRVADPHGGMGSASATVKVVQSFPLWFVVIGVMGAGVAGAVIFRELPRIFKSGDSLPKDCKYPEPQVNYEVRSGVEYKKGTGRELPDITVEIRSGIWEEDEKR